MYYNNFSELQKICEEKNCFIHEIVIKNECELLSKNESEIRKKVKERIEVMKTSYQKALNSPLSTVGSLIEGIASKQFEHSKNKNVCGEFINLVMARAFSCSECNASMNRICAAPTAGSCGIVPAVVLSLCEKENKSEDEEINAIITASGIGTIIMNNATVAGATGGCQAECGVAAAMASAAVVQIMGGSVKECLDAVSLTLVNCMGLICDPIAGLVQVPCAQRNASQAVNALLSADIILSGTPFILPTDEVVEAMYKVGKSLPHQLKETSLGGIAATPTANRIKNKIFGTNTVHD